MAIIKWTLIVSFLLMVISFCLPERKVEMADVCKSNEEVIQKDHALIYVRAWYKLEDKRMQAVRSGQIDKVKPIVNTQNMLIISAKDALSRMPTRDVSIETIEFLNRIAD